MAFIIGPDPRYFYFQIWGLRNVLLILSVGQRERQANAPVAHLQRAAERRDAAKEGRICEANICRIPNLQERALSVFRAYA